MLLTRNSFTLFSSPHPYLFFNQDGITMTFVGFHIDGNGHLLHPQNRGPLEGGIILEERIMNRDLMQGLKRQGVDLCCNYESWSRFVGYFHFHISLTVPEKTFGVDQSAITVSSVFLYQVI